MIVKLTVKQAELLIYELDKAADAYRDFGHRRGTIVYNHMLKVERLSNHISKHLIYARKQQRELNCRAPDRSST
jgi:hypothetical protein